MNFLERKINRILNEKIYIETLIRSNSQLVIFQMNGKKIIYFNGKRSSTIFALLEAKLHSHIISKAR